MVVFEAMLCGDVWDVVCMYGSSVFSSVFAITERSEMGLYDVSMLFQEDTSCTRLDCCRHLHKLCLHNPCPQR